MKELAMIIRPDKLEIVKLILDNNNLGGMTVTSVMGCGTQRGVTTVIKGLNTNVNLLPKIKVEVVVADEAVENILLEIREKVATGNVGDGKVFIKPVEDAMRIRTGERGSKAL